MSKYQDDAVTHYMVRPGKSGGGLPENVSPMQVVDYLCNIEDGDFYEEITPPPTYISDVNCGVCLKIKGKGFWKIGHPTALDILSSSESEKKLVVKGTPGPGKDIISKLEEAGFEKEYQNQPVQIHPKTLYEVIVRFEEDIQELGKTIKFPGKLKRDINWIRNQFADLHEHELDEQHICRCGPHGGPGT